MAETKGYNGHKNRTYWNVCLWLYNDEGLYNIARYYVRYNTNMKIAAKEMLKELHSSGIFKTSDGCKYSASNIYPVLVEMKQEASMNKES